MEFVNSYFLTVRLVLVVFVLLCQICFFHGVYGAVSDTPNYQMFHQIPSQGIVREAKCLIRPPMALNSRRTCSTESCTVTCLEGHKFYYESNMVNMKCIDGAWVPSFADLVSVPDCLPM